MNALSGEEKKKTISLSDAPSAIEDLGKTMRWVISTGYDGGETMNDQG